MLAVSCTIPSGAHARTGSCGAFYWQAQLVLLEGHTMHENSTGHNTHTHTHTKLHVNTAAWGGAASTALHVVAA